MMRFNSLKQMILVFAVILGSLTSRSQSYNVDLNLTPEQMVQNLVGPGVQISNVVVTACDSSYGYYTSTGTEIGTNQGLLLTTGKAQYSVGPNNSIGNCSTSAGTCDYFDNDCPGSSLLNLAQDRTTYDATMFEFDIVPQGDSLRFKYTFASEEYNEWVNSPFNDVFGFYITGPNIGTDVNLALVPNTSQVVAINTVNALSNNAYFYNNQNPLGQFIQYDGFTIGLSAQVGNLIPCETYHLKLVIADGTDHVYDSGVFINAIESNPVVVLTATSNGLDYMVEGCNTGTITFAREEVTSEPQDVIFWVGGTASNGTDYTPTIGSGIPDDSNTITIPANESSVSFNIEAVADLLDEGQEYLTIYLGNPLCSGNQILDSINFFIYDVIDIDLEPEVSNICVGQCVELTATSSLSELGSITWTGVGITPNGLIAEVCPTETSTYGVSITVGACEASDEVTVNVSSITVELVPTDVNCEGGSTGSMSANVIDALEPYTYAWTGPEGFTSDQAIISDLAPGIYCLDVTDAAGCIASACDTIIQTNELTATSLLSDYTCNQISCNGACDGSIDITVSGGVEPFDFLWSGPEGFASTEQNLDNLCAGTYELLITDDVGCEYTNTYTLVEPAIVELLVVGTVDLLCTGVETGEASVDASGGCAPYTYSWSHDAGLTGPVATELGSGTYEVSVEDQNGCTIDGSVTIVINDPIDPLNVTVDEVSVYPGGFSVSCPGSTDGFINITVTGGLEPYVVQWFSVTDNEIVSVSEDLVDVACGEYQLTVTDDNGCVYTQALQLTCVPAITVEYEVIDNPCGSPDVGLGSIDVTSVSGGQGGAYTFEWNGPSCSPSPCVTQNISNLNSGDYILTVTDVLGCQTTVTANIGQNDAFVATADVTNPTCAGECDGEIDITIDDAAEPALFPVNAATNITICFTADHSFVSDLAYHLVGPPACGSPDVLLSANPGVNCNTCCMNDPDGIADVVNLCFNTTSTDLFDVCSFTPNAASGTYGGGASLIDWSPLYGCDVTQPGWAVQIYDCVAGDDGFLLDATMTFVGLDNLGSPQSVTYSTAPGFNSPINDLACSPATASIFLVEQGSGGGGGGNYTYTWSGPFNGPVPTTQDVSGLCGGTYSVVISNGDCEQTLTFDLVEPEPLEVSVVEVINPTCFGQNDGSIDIDVAGGSGDYSYSWAQDVSCPFFGATSQDINNLAECVYTVTVTDNVTGCTGQLTVELIAPQVMEIVVVTSEFDGGYNISCHGANDGAISVFVTGGTPDCNLFAPHCYNYDWITDCSEIDPALYGNDPNAPNATNLPGGAYGINVTDANGCLATTCLDLLEPDSLASPAIIQNIDCNNATGCITPAISGGSNFYITYEWTGDIGDNNPSDATLCGLEAGDYSLTVTDSNGCQDTFEYTIEETPSLTSEITAITDATCYDGCNGAVEITVTGGVEPNCMLEYPDGSFAAFIPDSNGEIAIADLCAGDYTMTHTDAGGCIDEVSFTINQPDSINISLLSIIQEAGQVFDLQCLGDDNGAIDATVTGGTAPYGFVWTNELLEILETTEDIDSLVAGTYCLNVIDGNLCEATACLTLIEPETALEASGVVSVYNEVYNVSCYDATDGSIDITVTGGVAPYTFSWQGDGTVETDEDQINLGAGTYDVLIVDANFCQLTLSFTLVEPTPIQVDADVTNVTCFLQCNGEIDVTVGGGEGPYTYAWAGPDGFNSTDDDLVDLCAGEYFLTVTDAIGCTETVTFTIIEPDILGGVITPTFNCATGAITLCVEASGGTGPYNYQWSTGEASDCIEVDTDGEVCVDITDANGCTVNVCFDANVSSPFDISGTTTDANCGICDGTIDLTITGGQAPYDIDWSNSAGTEDLSNLCAGDYTVTVTDANGCALTETFTINQSASIDVTVNAVNVPCFGGSNGSASLTVTGGSGNYTYTWIDSNENVIGTSSSISELATGNYSVTVEDEGGCADTQQFSIGQASNLDIEITLSEFGDYNISNNNGSDGSILIDVTGGTPEYTYNWSPIAVDDTTTNPQNLPAGDYELEIVDANGCRLDTVITLIQPEIIKLYTALSPNGDGFNDTYVIDGVIGCGSNIFKVFNRWGNLVYEVKNYANQWYGQDDDKGTLADGTYFVIFEGCGVEVSTYVDLRRE